MYVPFIAQGLAALTIITRVFALSPPLTPMKGRFTVNPFPEVKLTPYDRADLEDVAKECVIRGLDFYTEFTTDAKRIVDLKRWKLIKEGEKLKVYSERTDRPLSGAAVQSEPTGNGLPMLLCVGTMEGKLDDLMFGVVSEDLETMRIKASYVDDVSGGAVLENVLLPTMERPFQSLMLKWMELDIPFRSTKLVKNRDFVYLEGTGYVTNAQGECFGYHVLHSVNFAQTHELPHRVRGNLSNVGIWRQVGPNTMETYSTGVMDPVDSGFTRKLVVSSMAHAFLSSLKYAYCGQMRKLTFVLNKKYAESKVKGTSNTERVCVTCASPASRRYTSDFGKTRSACKLCFGFVCSSCKIARKLSFVEPDLQLTQRNVTFCSACISEVTSLSALDVARAHIEADESTGGRSSFLHTLSSDDSGLDASYYTTSST